MIKYLLTLCLMFVFTANAQEKVYEFNATCQQAYKEISQLKIANALFPFI
ncbi:MAG: hypothetical protein NTZ59_05765 [Bacteroidetes bacterium]|nr:hypothetical protein [Bacteroidota bacterium]